MSSKIIHALFDDDDLLMSAVKHLKKKKYHIEEVFTPFPVHGLDKVMALPQTRLAITSFLYGLTGLLFIIWLLNYIMIFEWPMDIGGKPNATFFKNMSAFVPIMFEMTVFFAAHLMVITFYFRSRLWPFKEAENPDPRTTDGHFLIELIVNEKNENDLIKELKEINAVEIKTID